jgi:PIN domain nuclease of toxin-antitoxin system
MLCSLLLYWNDTCIYCNYVTTMLPTPKAVAAAVALLLSLLVITQMVIGIDLTVTGTTFFKTMKRLSPGVPTDGCLVVFHIAKTGGTSMKQVVKGVTNELGWSFHTWYGRDIKVPRDNSKTVASYSKRATHVGHILPHFLDLTSTHKCRRMTILRDPIDRVISLFYYQKHNETMWNDCLFGESDNDESCPVRHQYQNDMTRMFTGDGTVPGTWTAFGMQLEVPGNKTNASASGRNMDHSALQDAKQFLLDTDLVCFLDDFDRCEADLRKMLELEVTSEVPPALNVRNKPKIITNKLLSKIRSVNELDVELFEWAVLNFHHG